MAEATTKSTKTFVSNKDESVRMFKSDFMELFSKVHFTVPLYIFVPVILALFGFSFFYFNLSVWVVLGLMPLGVFLWTATEYLMHRFVFHFVPQSSWGLRLHFVFHGVHHDYPNDSRRLVMPPIISVTLGIFFFSLFTWLIGIALACPFFIGYVLGYLFYDLSHYALHHYNFKSKFWLDLKHHHMYHHYKEPDRGFGVSTKFWDHIFRTLFTKDLAK